MGTPIVSRLDALSARQLVGKLTGEAYARSSDVSVAAGLSAVAIRYETVAPGHRASALHAHSRTEEFALVLRGSPLLELGTGEVRQLDTGDFVGFPPGSGTTHAFVNASAHDASILLVAVEHPDDEVTYQ